MKTKFTQGEWQYGTLSNAIFRSEDIRPICDFEDARDDGIPEEEIYANAMLIKAAPKLLKQLEDVISLVAEGDEFYIGTALRDACLKARHLIQEATET